MSQLPLLSGRELVKIFEGIGYFIAHTRGSHTRLHHLERRPITVPNYKTIGRGLLRRILRQANLSPKEFLNLLN